MKLKNLIFFLLLLLLLPQNSYSRSAEDVLNAVDDMLRGESSKATFKMVVQTEHYKRTMEMTAWSKGKDKSFIIIEKPLKEKDTVTLKYFNDIYTYLPKTDRTIRLTSSMMGGSWMGSHLTNDDLIKESRLADDFDAVIEKEYKEDNHDVMVITLTPKENAAVVWGKITATVYTDIYVPKVIDYYDEDEIIVRTITYSDIKKVNGRFLAKRMLITPLDEDKKGEYTEVIYSDIEFDIGITDEFFSIKRLKKR